MKKFIYCIAAMTAMMLAGCQQEQLEPVSDNAVVTYSVEIPEVATKAAVVDDGSNINDLVYAVYRTTATKLEDVKTDNMFLVYQVNPESTTFTDNKTIVSLELVNDQNYVVLFWAQVDDAWVGEEFDLRSVTYPASMKANDSGLAAFCAVDFLSNVDAPRSRDIDLKRPFAQINVATTLPSKYTVSLSKSSVTVKKAGEKFNMLTQKAEGIKDVTFALADVPSGNLTVNGQSYTYAGMNYVFANGNVEVTYDIQTEAHGTVNNTVPQVPVEKNYRTNIIGNLLTSDVEYSVTLDNEWGTPDKEVKVVTVSSEEELIDAIENAGTNPGESTQIDLGADIDLSSGSILSTFAATKAGESTCAIHVPEGMEVILNLNGKTISQTKNQESAWSMILNDGNLTIVDTEGSGKISYTDSGNGGEYISDAIYNRGVLVINGGTIENLSSATVASNGYPHAVDTYSGIRNTSVTINGGTIYCAEYSAVRMFCVSATNAADLVINGGTIKGAIDMQNGTKNAAVGMLTINDGTFEITKNVNNIRFANWNGGATEYGLTAAIKGGSFNGSITTQYVPETANWNKGIITGGTFTVDPSDYVANGYVAKQNENSLWAIVPAPAVVEDGYEISNAAQLKYFAESVNAGENTYNGTTIKLAADIDLQNEPWTPIGFNSNSVVGSEKYFTGTFDGQDHTIRNLKIDVKDQGGVGLFGTVYNASFKNFTLENVDIKAVESEDDPANTSGAENHSNYIVGGHTGAVVGYDAKAGEVNFENVHVKGLVRIEGETRAAQGQRIGGIIGGRGSSKMTFKNVSVKGTDGSYIKGYCSTAGVSGQIQNVVTYENVHTDIDVYAVTFGAGGIAGIVSQGSTFTNCSSAGDITLDASKTQLSSYSANYPYRVGGMAGCWSESATGVLTLTDCTYTGNLTSIDRDGNTPQTLDYAGYVGRGYKLNGCAGSKVVINGVEYVQAYNTAAEAGIYIVDGVLEIASAAALRTLATNVNNGKTFEGKTVRLADDIDLNNEEWIPIGSATADHGFMGNFDGNGKTIRNLKMTELTTDSDNYVYAGLFGVTEGTESQENYIKNLVIENVTIETSGHIAAAAIAYPYYTTVENVTVKGNINIKGADYTAGVLAYTRRCVNAKNLVIEGNTGSSITGNQTVGGVISDIQMNGGLKANYSNFKTSGLTITGKQSVGGISGIISGQTLDGATVENVSLVSSDVRTGIIAGSLGSKSTIKNIKVTNVTGTDKVVGATYDDGHEVTVNGDEYGE